ncbi:MAG TPA: flagellar basal body L-ring protein FlgH [Oligoflexia bacterium]|nr:flagellar basal body L-ring protein FlgH [Oligoflexia bacterium]HMP49785.1 flagellar basal body L-ring protein FlgH [Oligoflexia bacterium]
MIKGFNVILFPSLLCFTGCGSSMSEFSSRYPAEDFSKAVRQGAIGDYSFRGAPKVDADFGSAVRPVSYKFNPVDGLGKEPRIEDFQVGENYQGDPRMLQQGLALKRSFSAPSQFVNETASHKGLQAADTVTMGGGAGSARGQLAGHGSSPSPFPGALNSGVNTSENSAFGRSDLNPPDQQVAYYAAPPPASQSPYLNGQMSGNPSLWMDSSQNVFTFGDHRAFNPMDIVTIEVNDRTLGRKRANTQTRSEFDLLAGIRNFFGLETNTWAANNTALDPAALIRATTQNEFRGEGDMQRQAQLQAQISAVVLEILPNGVLRIEGSKIVSINAEEEIMVVSGLIRQRDITAENKVDSNRVANMRIDFYGHGNLSDAQGPGWGAALLNKIWPF